MTSKRSSRLEAAGDPSLSGTMVLVPCMYVLAPLRPLTCRVRVGRCGARKCRLDPFKQTKHPGLPTRSVWPNSGRAARRARDGTWSRIFSQMFLSFLSLALPRPSAVRQRYFSVLGRGRRQKLSSGYWVRRSKHFFSSLGSALTNPNSRG